MSDSCQEQAETDSNQNNLSMTQLLLDSYYVATSLCYVTMSHVNIEALLKLCLVLCHDFARRPDLHQDLLFSSSYETVVLEIPNRKLAHAFANIHSAFEKLLISK